MNWLRSGIVAGVICLMLGGATAPARADAEADIKALQNGFIAAFRAKDLDAVMKFYAPDETLLVFDVVPPRQFVGATAYRKDWQEFFDAVDGPITVDMTDFVVQADGNLAWGHSIQHVVAKLKDGKQVDLTTRVTDIYKKVDGRWIVVHEHVSVPVDIGSGLADLNSAP
jgi:uncharacterized protein (TIGR02246 family)